MQCATQPIISWQTIALELVRGRGEQQLVLHVLGSDAGRDARLLVALLDPVRQPLQVAVAVQRVTSQRPTSIQQTASKLTGKKLSRSF